MKRVYILLTALVGTNLDFNACSTNQLEVCLQNMSMYLASIVDLCSLIKVVFCLCFWFILQSKLYSTEQ